MVSKINKKLVSLAGLVLACLMMSWSVSALAEEAETTAAEEALTVEDTAAAATSYNCTHGNKVRLIEVVYLNAPAKVPCEVHYSKETEEPGVTSTPWSAANLEGYCEDKAAAFAEKQRGWGWDCQ